MLTAHIGFIYQLIYGLTFACICPSCLSINSCHYSLWSNDDMHLAVLLFKDVLTPKQQETLNTKLPPWYEIMALENDLECSYFVNALFFFFVISYNNYFFILFLKSPILESLLKLTFLVTVLFALARSLF